MSKFEMVLPCGLCRSFQQFLEELLIYLFMLLAMHGSLLTVS
jgi:hypothetical protein